MALSSEFVEAASPPQRALEYPKIAHFSLRFATERTGSAHAVSAFHMLSILPLRSPVKNCIETCCGPSLIKSLPTCQSTAGHRVTRNPNNVKTLFNALAHRSQSLRTRMQSASCQLSFLATYMSASCQTSNSDTTWFRSASIHTKQVHWRTKSASRCPHMLLTVLPPDQLKDLFNFCHATLCAGTVNSYMLR